MAFIDILGFSALLKKMEQDPGLVSRVHGMLSGVDNFASSLCEQTDDFETLAFSDSVVLSAPEDQADFVVSSTHFLVTNLMRAGVFVRGAIVSGDLVHTGSVVFGPTFVWAYRLEKRAFYPRVIVEDEVHDMAYPKPEPGQPSIQFVAPTRRDDDGWIYVDPFSRDSRHSPPDADPKTWWMSTLRKKIMVELKHATAEKNAHVRAKFLWLANHFNQAVEHEPPGVDSIETPVQPW